MAIDPKGVSFADVARDRGLRHVGAQQRHPLRALEAFGSGCAVFDGDNDGWQDVLLIANPHPVIHRNEGGTRFVDVTATSGLTQMEGDWHGCAIGDYDADGLLDIVLTGYRCLALYRGLGGLRYELATEESGLAPDNHSLWGTSAGFMDLDGDGPLDLVILNFVVFGPETPQYCELMPGIKSGCPPKSYTPERGEIWHNTGQGRFELIPDTAGMDQTHGVGLVLAFTDLDRDGRMDFYIGNDGVAADLLHNQGNMRFENIGASAGVSVAADTRPVAAMGVDFADYDRDGLLDLTVTNWQKTSFVLFRYLGNNCFIDASLQTSLTRTTRSRLGFGAKWLDFDNDGWPDICYVNGHVYDNAADVEGKEVTYRQSLLMLRNEESRRFVDLTPALDNDVRRPMVGRGSATADFDNDGRIDLLIVDLEGPVMLLDNRTRSTNHWLTLDLRGATPNRFAYGARLIGKAGKQIWVSEVSPVSSYLSSSDPRIHWGLGDVSRLDTITVRWPSGQEQTLHDVAGDQILHVDEQP